MMAHVQEKEGTSAAMVDSAAEAESDRLGDALVELEADGVGYGSIALTIALHGDLEEIERLDGEVRRIFHAHDAKVIREGYGQLPAWFCRLPAQPRSRQIRSVFASAGTGGLLGPDFRPAGGESAKQAPGTRFAGRVGDPGGRLPTTTICTRATSDTRLVLGATGSGKSFMLNFLLVSALQYSPRVLILDLGGSYRWLTSFLGGGYLELSPSEKPDHAFRLRPFSLPATERSYQFLTGWIARLLRIGGGEVSGNDTSEIRDRVEDLYLFPPERRTLGALVRALPSKMWPALSRWHGEGAWGAYFDNPAVGDELQLRDWQVIDLAGAAEHEDLCEAALFYLLERMRLALEDPAETARVKLMVVDEAWRYLRDPAVLAYLGEAAKTWRKKNAALILATQSAVDVTAHGWRRGAAGVDAHQAVPGQPGPSGPGRGDVPACAECERSGGPACPGTDPQAGALSSPAGYGGRSCAWRSTRRGYWLYTSSPREAEKRARAVEQYGLKRAIKTLAEQGGTR